MIHDSPALLTWQHFFSPPIRFGITRFYLRLLLFLPSLLLFPPPSHPHLSPSPSYGHGIGDGDPTTFQYKNILFSIDWTRWKKYFDIDRSKSSTYFSPMRFDPIYFCRLLYFAVVKVPRWDPIQFFWRSDAMRFIFFELPIRSDAVFLSKSARERWIPICCRWQRSAIFLNIA